MRPQLKLAHGKKVIIQETICLLGQFQFTLVVYQLFIFNAIFHFSQGSNFDDVLFGYLISRGQQKVGQLLEMETSYKRCLGRSKPSSCSHWILGLVAWRKHWDQLVFEALWYWNLMGTLGGGLWRRHQGKKKMTCSISDAHVHDGIISESENPSILQRA